MIKSHFDHIPGLFVYPNYFSQPQCSNVIEHALEVYTRLENSIGDRSDLQQVSIPQPKFVRSEEHNLPSEEFYARLVLTESDERTIRCEYFPRYGEDGHALCYFQSNRNLPDFVRQDLLEKIHHTIQQEGLVTAEQKLRWKLTMNFYKNLAGRVAGFPFHVDIPSNGIVTMILNVHKEALFQIAKDDVVQDIQLQVGSLLLLSGESRYEWKHRVLPKETDDADSLDRIERVSLVLGYQ